MQNTDTLLIARIKNFSTFIKPQGNMGHKMFDAFSRAFEEKKKGGLNNIEAFDRAKEEFTKNFEFSPYKDAESFIATRSYHRREERNLLRRRKR
jgi:hypothetical protein